MITQLVSNIGILARHGKFSTGLFTSRTTPHRYMLEYIHGGVVTSESLLIFTHSEKMTVSIISHSFHIIGFVVCLFFAHPCFTKPLCDHDYVFLHLGPPVAGAVRRSACNPQVSHRCGFESCSWQSFVPHVRKVPPSPGAGQWSMTG